MTDGTVELRTLKEEELNMEKIRIEMLDEVNEELVQRVGREFF